MPSACECQAEKFGLHLRGNGDPGKGINGSDNDFGEECVS
jgi:hypothetical protein